LAKHRQELKKTFLVTKASVDLFARDRRCGAFSLLSLLSHVLWATHLVFLISRTLLCCTCTQEEDNTTTEQRNMIAVILTVFEGFFDSYFKDFRRHCIRDLTEAKPITGMYTQPR
jgi:hypothetical protein